MRLPKIDADERVSRPRTTTARLRSAELMMQVVSDREWNRPKMIVDRCESPPRDIVAVAAADGSPGVAVGFWEDGRALWAIALPEEGPCVNVRYVGAISYVLLHEDADRRWPERAIAAARIQRDNERAAQELTRYERPKSG